jgi:hypothetical protein
MIYAAKFNHEPGDVTLADIQKMFMEGRTVGEGFSYQSLVNHATKHITRNPPTAPTRAHNIDLKAKQARVDSLAEQIGLDEEDVAKIGELVQVAPVGDAEEALDAIIDQGVARIKTGEIKVQVSHIIQAAKAKLEHKNRKQDQQLELTKMVYRFAAGKETKLIEEENVTKEPTGSSDRGPEQSRSVHNEVTRDAVTQWATQVPSDYTEPTD